jgi:hypothetical protein
VVAICWFLALNSRRKSPAHPIESPYYYYYWLRIPSISRNLVFSTIPAELLQTLFSQFSKSWILTIWVISGFHTFTVTVVSPVPMLPTQS